jgi:hypothetical protein
MFKRKKTMNEFDKAFFTNKAKTMKEDAVELMDGIFPPVIFVERDNKIQAVIVAPEVDKYMALHAAKIGRIGFNADAIIMLTDAHIATAQLDENTEKKLTAEQAYDLMKNKFPPGSMQKKVNSGQRGDILDVILCHRVTKDGKYSMIFLPYRSQDKKIHWIEDHPAAVEINGSNKDMECIGLIPESLRDIMQEKAILERDDMDEIKKAGNILSYSPERQLYHIGRAVLKFLESQGFKVADMQEKPQDDNTPDEIIVSHVAIGDLIPQKAIQEVVLLIANNPDPLDMMKPDIVEILKKYHEEILERAKKANVSAAEVSLESLADAIIVSRRNRELQAKNRRQPPFKVNVTFKDDEGTTFIRSGMYIEDVEIFFAIMPNGDIETLRKPEIPLLTDVQKRAGARIETAGLQPKLVMENAEVFYGCQVKWEEAKDD